MKRIKIFIFGIMAVLATGLTAQNVFDSKTAQIPLSIIIPTQADYVPQGASAYLANKLQQVATANGVSATQDFGRFFITARITPLSKDIVPGPPAQVSQNLEMTLYIADYVDQKVFASTSINITAVGTNETKSLINGIKTINVNSPQLAQFVETGKQRILDYYQSQCRTIVNNAKSMAARKQFEAALASLTGVPTVSDCYDEALAVGDEIFQQYVDELCDRNLAKARSVWAAGQDYAAADEAAKYLSGIYPYAKCYPEAMELYNDIKGRIREYWTFEMKVYDDAVSLEEQRINAMREVGIAFGNNQQPQTYMLDWLFR